MKTHEELIDNLSTLKARLFVEGKYKEISYKDNKDIELIQNAIDTIREYDQQNNPPSIQEINPKGSYILKFDTDIWDVEHVSQYIKMFSEYYPEAGFVTMTKNDLVEEETNE